ncbi:hypothetical protein SAMD00019534_055710 [Acytostelium subglobosum LB1]|uniref:hypothetical protein n=1 Tax=Acytostelium subglobosum LB1 TaxID=1410327 RepID=UPI0006448F0A|nr:hypothetical protein SAMD00019534_055710 [Acytostelium subglobosum LB1]GAM22396.1 hypothetical protein SAMD00019534_055710 [Acytostelium subglobosum LB1]|eukprot:XP_012754516.1 hypothetical protein SAMD00019534_055710 [Acytostelium subglobosum LB1]
MGVGVSVLIRNERFTFKVPSPAGSSYVVFSQKYSISKSVSWITDVGSSIDIPMTVSVSLLSANISTSTATFGLKSMVSITNPNQVFQTTLTYDPYPSISSYTKTRVSSTSITFFGYFGNIFDKVLVTINGASWTVTNSNSSMIQCTNNGNLKSGYAELSLIVNGESFISNRTLVIFPDEIPDDCGAQSSCNGNGNCVNGRCQCSTGFGGNYCESKGSTTGVDITSDAVRPATTIKTANETFMFAIIGVQELDVYGDPVNLVSTVDNLSYDISTPIPGVTSYMYNLSSPTPDQSDLRVALQIDVSTVPRTVDFAGQSVSYPANSVKLTMTIDNWTFKSNLNSLRVLLHKDGSLINDTSRCGTKNVVSIDQLDNVQYLKVINSNGVELFGRFLHYALSDGRPAISRNEIINTTDTSTLIGINLPHCLQRCIVDPDFTVLFSDANLLDPDYNDECKGGKDNKGLAGSVSWKLIVIIVIPIVATFIIITVLIVVIVHKLHGRRLKDVVSHKLKKMSRSKMSRMRLADTDTKVHYQSNK